MTAVLWFWASVLFANKLVTCGYAMQHRHALSELLQRETYKCYVKWFTLKAEQLGKKCWWRLRVPFPLEHFQQKHSIACMQAALSRQVATTCLAHTLQQVCTWWDGFRQALATWCSTLSQPRAQNLLQCLQVTIQGCWTRCQVHWVALRQCNSMQKFPGKNTKYFRRYGKP